MWIKGIGALYCNVHNTESVAQSHFSASEYLAYMDLVFRTGEHDNSVHQFITSEGLKMCLFCCCRLAICLKNYHNLTKLHEQTENHSYCLKLWSLVKLSHISNSQTIAKDVYPSVLIWSFANLDTSDGIFNLLHLFHVISDLISVVQLHYRVNHMYLHIYIVLICRGTIIIPSSNIHQIQLL